MLLRLVPGLALMALAASAGSASAQCDRRFTLRNVSGAQVNEFYFGSSRNPSWGPDRLGENVLPSGRTQDFRTAQGDLQDFKVVWENSQAAELRQVDICSTNEIVATRNGLSTR
ncbi:hypothetical protein ACFQX4_22670 [Roseomonas sp. GCM10028921]